MSQRLRSRLVFALLFIGLGVWFLAIEFSPPLRAFAYGAQTWPLPIIGLGAAMALFGLLAWQPGWLIPASIVAGIGGLLYWQNATGDWESWAYAWTLIPGFVGIGLLLAGLLRRRRGMLLGAGWTLFSSMLLFAIFGSFLGGRALVLAYWPVLLIAVGVIFLGSALFKRS